MSNTVMIPVTNSTLSGRPAQLVDARLLHQFLEVGRDFSTWIKERVEEFSFVEGEDFMLIAAPPIRGAGNRGKRTDYFLTLDMAKELAMVERTPQGRQIRRYFIECEQQLRQLQQALPPAMIAVPARLSRAERQAINRQAWADVAGQTTAAFHARRESLIQARLEESKSLEVNLLPTGFRPSWALRGGVR